MVIFDHRKGKARRVSMNIDTDELLQDVELSGHPQSPRGRVRRGHRLVRREPQLALLLERGGILDGGFIVADPTGSRRRLMQLKLLSSDRRHLLKALTVDLTGGTVTTESGRRPRRPETPPGRKEDADAHLGFARGFLGAVALVVLPGLGREARAQSCDPDHLIQWPEADPVWDDLLGLPGEQLRDRRLRARADLGCLHGEAGPVPWQHAGHQRQVRSRGLRGPGPLLPRLGQPAGAFRSRQRDQAGYAEPTVPPVTVCDHPGFDSAASKASPPRSWPTG